MNKKFLVITIVVIALLVPTSAAGAWYANVTGELRDSATNALWVHGASVEVFHCTTLATINTATVAFGNSSFSIDVSSVTSTTPLCIEVTFAAGPNGTPGNAAKGPYPDRATSSGTLNTGVYFTGTGPNAVTLTGLNASPVTTPWPLILSSVIVVAGLLALGAILRRRAARA